MSSTVFLEGPYDELFRVFEGPYDELFSVFGGPYDELFSVFGGPYDELFRVWSSLRSLPPVIPEHALQHSSSYSQIINTVLNQPVIT